MDLGPVQVGQLVPMAPSQLILSNVPYSLVDYIYGQPALDEGDGWPNAQGEPDTILSLKSSQSSIDERHRGHPLRGVPLLATHLLQVVHHDCRCQAA